MRDRPSLLTQRLAGALSFVLLGAILSAGGCASPASTPPPPPTPAWAPDVPLTTLTGDRTDLVHAAGGRVALVSLWATWCEGCAKEVDALSRLDAQARARGDAVVIGVDVGEEPAQVGAFTRARGLQYAQLIDRDYRLADAIGERRIPATLVLDRRGRLVFRGDALDEAALSALRGAIATP
jgi:peroxiredoxin